jgi:hypothetical protein
MMRTPKGDVMTKEFVKAMARRSEVLELTMCGEITNGQAAMLLEASARTVIRWKRILREEGVEGAVAKDLAVPGPSFSFLSTIICDRLEDR